jgi:hypothetical protein
MSAAKKKSMAMTANTRTITVEIMVSRREGHVTFAVSARTCWRKVKGFVVFEAMCRSVFKTRRPGLLDDPAGRDVPLERDADAESAPPTSPTQIRRVKPASQLHASRVCSVYIKPILGPRKWQVFRFMIERRLGTIQSFRSGYAGLMPEFTLYSKVPGDFQRPAPCAIAQSLQIHQ